MEFPHLNTKGGFPGVEGVNVYKYDNKLDYSRYDYDQMDVQVCRVPWDMGEAHAGQRTITGIGNVVYFETAAMRDEWFEEIPDNECFRWSTKFKELHRDMTINVPLPFDIAARYNYVVVKYHLFANDDSTLEYENGTGVREWFYFIREVNFIAPNTTQLVLMDDSWQTWIYDVDVTGMVLERGHAPLFKTPTDKFLASPIDNNEGLLTEDVTYGDLQQVTSSDALKLNDEDVYMCIATSSGVPWLYWGKQGANWQDKDWDTERGDWITRGAQHTATGRVPEYRVIACKPSDFNPLFEALDAEMPQFIQTIQGIFFVERKYLVFGNSGDSGEYVKEDGSFHLNGGRTPKLADITMYWVRRGTDATTDFTTLTKDKFRYGKRYEDIAKLYTFPYAAIEISDENGNTTLVKVEDTTGKIQANVACNLAFPFISLDANLKGIGGTRQANIKFANLSEDSRNFSGRWYEQVRSWDIPCFIVIVEASKVNEYDEYFDRMQKRVEYENAYEKAGNDAELARKNNLEINDSWKNSVDVENAVQKTIADNQASSNSNLIEAQITAEKNLNYKNPGTNRDTGISIQYKRDVKDMNNDYLDVQNGSIVLEDFTAPGNWNEATQGYNNVKMAIDYYSDGDYVVAGYWANAESTAATAWVGGVETAASGAVSGAIGGGLAAGPIGAAGGAAAGIASGIATGISSTYTASIVISKNKAIADLSLKTMESKVKNALNYNVKMNEATKNYNTTMTACEIDNTDLMAKQRVNVMNEQSNQFYGEKGYMKLNADALKKARDSYNRITDRAKKNTYNRAYNYTYLNNQDIVVLDGMTDYGNISGNKTNAWLARDTARNAIINRQDQRKLETPRVFGQVANAQTATTRPMALFANVVTQSDSAIKAAGDEFLRYGYEYEQQWEFDGNWNIGAHFTYWKLSDFWVRGLQVPDLYMDKIRFFLYGGVTVWRKPEDIGNITIYDNWNEKSTA